MGGVEKINLLSRYQLRLLFAEAEVRRIALAKLGSVMSALHRVSKKVPADRH
jgi:hypothetical protein